jgi:aerobic-type carbon monoxide dehydrogenase small subunit (CoxS/CutS family)
MEMSKGQLFGKFAIITGSARNMGRTFAECLAGPKPSDRDIDLAMHGNICRRSTYVRIRTAIKDAAASLGG